ncbi:MAG: glycosyltransferase [Parvularculaceae bacterium]
MSKTFVPYLEAARLAVATEGIARGVQNKVFEAMAMGKAVVSMHRQALYSIDAVIGSEAIAAASPEMFA